jgi:hypothetical protein
MKSKDSEMFVNIETKRYKKDKVKKLNVYMDPPRGKWGGVRISPRSSPRRSPYNRSVNKGRSRSPKGGKKTKGFKANKSQIQRPKVVN